MIHLARRLALAAFLSVPAFAQGGSISFEPNRDLPGFEVFSRSEWKDLFPIDEYTALLSVEMTPEELADTQAKWKAACDAGKAKLEELRASPDKTYRWRLTTDLARHDYFGKVALTEDTSVPGWHLVLQRPPKDDAAYARRIVADYAPWLARITQLFDERVAQPAQLERRSDFGAAGLAVLATPGDYATFLQNARALYHSGAAGGYDADLRLVVVREDPFTKVRDRLDRFYPVTRQAVVALFNAHWQGREKIALAPFVIEGYASHLAFPSGMQPESLGTLQPRATMLKRLATFAGDAELRPRFLYRVDQLADAVSMASLWALEQARANGSPLAVDWPNASRAFFGSAQLWVAFFEEGPGKDRIEGWRKYVRSALNGRGGADMLRASLGDADLVALDREFWTWVLDANEAQNPNQKVERSVIEEIVKVPPRVEAKGGGASASAKPGASGAARAAPAPFDPRSLALGSADVEARHGVALVRARAGDLDGAKTALEALAQGADERAALARRDVQRVTAAIAFREAFVTSIAKAGSKLPIERDGKKHLLPIARVEAGKVVFGENKAGIAELPLASLDPYELAKQYDKKEALAGVPAWTRAWLYLVADDARWDKLLKDEGDEAKALRADAKGHYAKTLAAGRAGTVLEELATLPLPRTRAEADRVIEGVRKAIEAGVPAASPAKRPALASFARAAYEGLANEVDAFSFVHGKAARMGDGTVLLEYDFLDPAQGQDFVQGLGAHEEFAASFPKIEDPKPVGLAKDGALALKGIGAWNFVLPMESPLEIDLSFAYEDRDGRAQIGPLSYVALCEQGSGKVVLCELFGDLHARDDGTGLFERFKTGPREFTPGRVYELAIRHDGTRVKSTLDGQPSHECEAGPRKRGRVSILVSSDYHVVISRLSLRGKIDASGLPELRAGWVDGKLRELGL